MDRFERAAQRHKGLYVTVTYDLSKFIHRNNDADYDNVIEKLAKRYDGEEFGSGGGFGGRDISFGFTEEKQAKAFMKECKKVCKKHKLDTTIAPLPLDEYYSVE